MKKQWYNGDRLPLFISAFIYVSTLYLSAKYFSSGLEGNLDLLPREGKKKKWRTKTDIKHIRYYSQKNCTRYDTAKIINKGSNFMFLYPLFILNSRQKKTNVYLFSSTYYSLPKFFQIVQNKEDIKTLC